MKIDVKDEDGNGVAAKVFLWCTDANGEVGALPLRLSDESGSVSFDLPAGSAFECALVRAAGFWSAYRDDVAECSSITIRRLPDIVEPAWWLNCMGIDTSCPTRGENIKIGVVDRDFFKAEGIRHVHEVVGTAPESEDEQELGHGEVVCRLLGDHSEKARRWMSVAPGAEILFADAGHDQLDDAISSQRATVAINRLIKAGVHLINLSWGEPIEDEGVLAAIKTASELGVTVVAASGNDAGQEVYFPARHESCIAVTAFGRTDWGGPGSVVEYDQNHSEKIGKAPNGDEIYLWCNSTCGSDVNATAPGAGILVQRNNRIEVAVSGTSFAAPLACGALAVALGMDKEYLEMPRSKDRTQYARRTFLKMCVPVGLDQTHQGSGSPFAAEGR